MYKIQPKTEIVGKNFHYLPSCQSTNVHAMNLIQKNDCKNGTIVITGFQTEGKGQRGNTWEAQKDKNILISVILDTSFLLAINQFELNMAISLAILDFLKPYDEENFKVKWPNDLYFKNKKMGGILIENLILGNKLQNSIIGIGLNINQTTFEGLNAISLKEILPKSSFRLENLIENLCLSIEKRYVELKKGHSKFLKREYLYNLVGYNQTIKFKNSENIEFQGKIIDISENGKLVVSSNEIIQSFDIKEITFLL